MSHEEFIGHPIDEVVIDPSSTPYGYGIGRCSTQTYDSRSNGDAWKELWAITRCCSARTVLDREDSVTDWPWKCDACDKKLAQPGGTENPRVSIYILTGRVFGPETPEEWVSLWTGYPVDSVYIDIEY